MLKTLQMMQKLKTFKKYSTLSHQPGTPWGYARNIHELFLSGTLGPKLHLTEICV